LENRLVVVSHPDCELVGRKEISLERLLQERFIDRELGSGTQLAVSTLFKEFGLTPKPYIRLGSSEAIKQAVMAGLGLAVLSIHNIRLELAHQRLKILDVKEFPLYRKWYVGYPSAKSLSLVARTFISFIVNESEEILSHLEINHQ
jgi:DNA-binding transcriptional LysR family regulator